MRRILILAPLVLLAQCVAPPAPPPPVPRPVPVPVPPRPAPVPPRTGSDWRDWPVTPGTWVYRSDARGSIALFGRRDLDAEFTIRCDRQARQVYLSRRGIPPATATMTIRTSSTARTITALPTGGVPAYTAVAVGPRDSILDAMGYSRGRFIVETTGMPVLVIPVWPEVLRVTEDCRG